MEEHDALKGAKKRKQGNEEGGQGLGKSDGDNGLVAQKCEGEDNSSRKTKKRRQTKANRDSVIALKESKQKRGNKVHALVKAFPI